MSIVECLKDFNETFEGLIGICNAMSPNGSLIKNNIDLITKNIKRNPETIIRLFAIYALPYKAKIDSGDETFFMGESYDKIVDGDKQSAMIINEIKKVWAKLGKSDFDMAVKENIKDYMKTLIGIADEYINRKCVN